MVKVLLHTVPISCGSLTLESPHGRTYLTLCRSRTREYCTIAGLRKQIDPLSVLVASGRFRQSGSGSVLELWILMCSRLSLCPLYEPVNGSVLRGAVHLGKRQKVDLFGAPQSIIMVAILGEHG